MKKFNAFFSAFLFLAFISLFCSVAWAQGEIPVKSVTVEALEGTQNVTPGHILHMTAGILPKDATNQSVTWSVINGTGVASISADGVLLGEQTGTVTIRATANDGSNAYGEIPLEIVNFLGEGTLSNPYRIDNAQDLSCLASLVNAGNSPYSDKYYMQTQDIDLSQFLNWIPIGKYMNSFDSNFMFCGTYDGNEKSITGLHMEIDTNTKVIAGLFGCLNGQVKNLSLKDTSINIKNSTDTSCAGAIAGYMQYGRIENCQSEGMIQVKDNSNRDGYAGGIVGLLYQNCSVQNCTFSGSIALSAHYAYAGGIVGYSSYDISIQDCGSAGNIRAEGYLADAAGIVGYINISGTQNIIANCYNTADVSHYAESSGLSSSAGIAAYISDTMVSDCYNIGKISADNSINNNAGGIAGENNNILCSFNHCYNTGLVTGAARCGGIIGHTRGSADSLSYCYYLDNTQSGVGQGAGTAYKKTWNELIAQNTYEGFDFTNVWTMEQDIQAQTHYKLPQIRTSLYYPPCNPVSLLLNIEGAGNITGSGAYTLGESVSITAVPNTGYHFIRWEVRSGNLPFTSTTDLSVSFAMPANAIEIMAIFEKDQYNLTINNDGNGAALGGGLHGWGDAVNITAQPAAGYRFSHWEVVSGEITVDEPYNAQNSFVMPQNEVVVKAHFVKIKYTVTVNAEGNGTVKGGGAYDWGDEVKISAEPETGYHFKNWQVKSGDITLSSITDPLVSFTMPANAVEIMAVFEKDRYRVRIEDVLTGMVQEKMYYWDETVRISQEPPAYYCFSHWEVVQGGIAIEDPLSAQSAFTMPKNDVVIKAYAEKKKYGVLIAGNENGTLYGGGLYSWDTIVYISAVPEPGYYFKNWKELTGPSVLMNASLMDTGFFMPKSDILLQAVFEKIRCTVDLKSDGSGTEKGGGTYDWGSKVTLTARPKDSFRFVCWKKDGLILSCDYDYTFTIKSSDTIQAVYEPIGAPVLNNVESVGFDSICVSWDPVAGASGYIVCCATSAAGVYREIDNIANTQYVMSGLTMAKPYFFRVKAYCKTGNTLTYGGLSSYKFASPMPAVPPAFKAMISGKKIKLSWGKVEKATKYELYRALSPNGRYKRLADTAKNNYTDKITKGKTYYYKIRSYFKKNKKTYYYSGFTGLIIKP